MGAVTIPADTPPGPYWVIAQANATNLVVSAATPRPRVVAEADESINARVTAGVQVVLE